VQTAPSRDHDDSHDWEVGGSGTRCISIATRSDKHSVRPPMNHFKRLLEEACPNHAYCHDGLRRTPLVREVPHV
jgi:hypothetical protein